MPSKPVARDWLMNRKDFIRKSCALGAGAAMLSAQGCSWIFDSEMRLGKVADIRKEGFVIREFNWDQIIVLADEDNFRVFSLTCSHKRCTVEWIPREQIFLCPCHEGQYDQYGEVIDGPPPAPLRRLRCESRGEELWVLNERWKGDEPEATISGETG